MDVGIFNLMGYRNRGVPTAAIYDQTIAQVKAAEAAGFNIAHSEKGYMPKTPKPFGWVEWGEARI